MTQTTQAAELAAKLAGDADQEGRLSPEVVQELIPAGFPRHFVPERWGGADKGFAEITEAAASIGEGCPSAAWCAVMFAYTGRFAAHLPIEGQRDLWGESPDVVLVPGLIPQGEAEEADGGFRLNGRWAYVSGVEFSDWAFIAGPAKGEVEPRFFAVPRGDFTIEETWNAIGMRATGSHTLVASDVFVPEHRAVSFAEVMGGINHTSDRPHHNVPLPAVGGLTCIAALIGAARGALGAAAGIAAAKRSGGGPVRDATTAGLSIATAAAQIDSAELLVDRIAASLDRGGARRFAFRNARDAAYAARLLVEAANELMRSAGTSAQDQTNDLQRFWRDITVGASHAALRFERPAAAFTEGLLKARS